MEDIVFLDSIGVPRARICLAGGSSFDSTGCGVTPPFLTPLKYVGMVGRGYNQVEGITRQGRGLHELNDVHTVGPLR